MSELIENNKEPLVKKTKTSRNIGRKQRGKIKILFIRTSKSSFIQKDLELLRKHFEVRVVDFVLSKKNLKGTLMTPFKMINGVLWADVTFSWFADTHASWAVRLSKLFRKKAIVVVGGYEVAKVPEIGLGAMLNPKSARRVEFILEKADKILAVSEFNKKEIFKYTDSKNVKLVYHGVDYNYFIPKGTKEDLAITVGYVKNHNLKRKGLESFVRSAKYLPDVKFVLIGEHLDDSISYLKSIATQNVEFTGFVSDKELIKWYQRAKVYCQLSLHEAFGVTLAEAMACECIPIVTSNGALPEVAGDTGFCVPYDDPEATAEAIKKGLKSDKRKEARERVKKKFLRERREEELIKIINEVTQIGT
jgi:glycosyltransferase involved in cell wall biosynthesis